MADPTLYLFDGYNVLHSAGLEDRRELVDMLASFVALHGARGVVVFDGVGVDEERGSLEVRFAPHADAVLERLAAEHRGRERVCLVSSDAAIRGTSGQEVAKVSSGEFAAELAAVGHREDRPSRVGERLDEETRARLEKMRRGPVE
ncbi:MAG TPA: NYN domain-containing protein [Gaiellaceae bacterium]|jgi:predicted RNA-binding protein with PIN domain|nr:NYN domain-containing protein [Gaiellaceae bacterium]